MIQAGNAIDCSIGVTFGLSTLTAAAVGQVCSNGAGILFGGTIGNLAKAGGLPSSNLSSLQRTLPIIKQTRMGAQLAGVLLGCTLGLVNLLLIDTERSSSLKLQNNRSLIGGISGRARGNELDFEIETSNDLKDDATTLVVRGPDVDGLLANMTSVLSANGCSLLELSARKRTIGGGGDSSSGNTSGDDASIANAAAGMEDEGEGIEDVFVVVNRETNEPLSNIEMEEMAQILMNTTNLRPNDHSARVKELEERNSLLTRRIKRLETVSSVSLSQGDEEK